MAAQCILAYWMLPINLDRALDGVGADSAKVATLVACAFMSGDPLQRAAIILQMFFLGFAISMTAGLGCFLVSTDARLCNSYSLDSRGEAGLAMIAWAFLLAGAWIVRGGGSASTGARTT